MRPHTRNPPPCNSTEPWVYNLCPDDANWVLMASFIIFTMQTGFGMLESGCVSVKNEANLLMKNFVDIVFGGLTYWLFGFGMSFGDGPGSTPFLGIGSFVVDSDIEHMGPVFAAFMFQMSFATTATTIVSGTMAERCNFKAYCLFSFLNTIVYCVPARWLWDASGFLKQMGAVDIAGSCAVHVLGGTSGFVAAWMLGPRQGRYDNGIQPLPLGNPMNSLVGLFVLWWGWLAFNSGSTYGVQNSKWEFAARAAANTMLASIGGGVTATTYCFVRARRGSGKYIEVIDLVNPILGSLVASTAGCAIYHTYEAFLVGIIGAGLVIGVSSFADRLRVDDPVNATAVHGFAGLWGMLAVGFIVDDYVGLDVTNGQKGIFKGGGAYLLQIQLFSCLCIIIWSAASTFFLLWLINKIIPIRMCETAEILGADFEQHSIRRNPITGQVITERGNDEDWMMVCASDACQSSINPKCRLRKSIIAFNRWRKIRLKAFAASIFATGLRQKRKMATAGSSSMIAISEAVENNKEQQLCYPGRNFPRLLSSAEFTLENYLEEKLVRGVEIGCKKIPRLRHTKL